MIYSIRLSDRVKDDLARLAKSEPKAFAKAGKFIEELRVHPKTGTGHPEPLKGLPEGRWSRQITKKHRLIYQIFETEVYVDVLAAYGHYDDK
ncbi:MAG: Txe/YoeB family addiction module toxin [Prevotella sp.]|nr:Txe/YoeB family addiction module toxin [Prevotella sp.]MDY4161751.1 Txe/YoeB family addiction module toxin [Prevotella sp.]